MSHFRILSDVIRKNAIEIVALVKGYHFCIARACHTDKDLVLQNDSLAAKLIGNHLNGEYGFSLGAKVAIF